MGAIRINRKYHEARWDEPIIMDMGRKGQRGIEIDEVEPAVKCDVASLIPAGYARKNAPKLPELSQMEVVRHYTRLSQETIGTDNNIDIGLGTCTMKYSPKINETFARSPKLTELHPYQPVSTVQGMLEIMYNTAEYMKEISGLDSVTLQPSGGTQAIYANVATIRAYHAANGEGEQRDTVITTMLSHPGNPGAAHTAGYKIITLMPNAEGYPDIEMLKAAVNEHTAALMITNPEDTGLYNPRIREFVDLVHSVGGLCSYDQANLNGVFCLTRAKEAGFDMCHFNLHKSFSSPHGCQGPAGGAQCVRKELAKFQTVPRVEFDGEKYFLNYNYPESVGKLRKFYGNPGVIIRSYAYIRALGQEGLTNVSELSILNNNWMLKKMLDSIEGLTMPLADGVPRLEQARLSWEELYKKTGVTTDDICRRICDYGFQDYFASHHPRIIPEPFTPEPCECYSLDDITEYVEAFKSIAKECYTNPEIVKTAPHSTALQALVDERGLNDMKLLATTWRAFQKIKDLY